MKLKKIVNATLHRGDGSRPTSNATVIFNESGIIFAGDTREAPSAEDAECIDASGAPVCPGYIDIHHHGAAGHAYDDGPEAAQASLAAHRLHGTTRSVLSLVTGDIDKVEQRIRDLVPLVKSDPLILGLHPEGPCLHPDHKGAHPEHLLRDPEPTIVERLIEAGEGTVKQFTLAPERTGGLDSCALLAKRGVAAAVGHTSATFEQAEQAFETGASILTHAFNGMKGIHHRAPGPVIAALRNENVWIEVINDGIHVHPAVVRSLFLEASERIVLVTDSMSATCNPDGEYMLGDLPVIVTGGKAMLKEGNSLAGSTLTMDYAVSNAVKNVGVPLEVAIAAATHHPAKAIGVGDEFGLIEPNYPADLLILDPDTLLPTTIIAAGNNIYAA
ncbi:N-acetylglucosamine-6-phosphate deacetylase [Corynebacterium pseudopelargi]|uniref:N-acetylglucosamine-6-phosphate deacetylase n=1 Tax=Corynebacterium pseudopelargi TaxID=2080757 RepID=A0A3G6IVX9_9CORY|nr:N-acetylglucosamine-6-phosphate deacetylase [Corynebacterium pseudopelargi]AZA08818.1 N-acetylglucosamine-6-phosphate deacetylase [Corynebacterium pseudopelargi]